MNQKIKAILMACLMLAALVFVSGCSGEETPYEKNDAENYTVSVKFDANGGFFTTNTSVIVDSFNISEMKADGSGKVQIPLLSTDDPARDKDAFTPVKNGYFLLGWYAQRTQTADGYTYAKKWDFEKDRLAVDVNGEYTSTEPQLTLYAVWAPLFDVQIYDMDSGDLLDSISYNPVNGDPIRLPAWDLETGTMEMYKFPTKDGCTFDGAYYDAEGTMPVEGETLTHTGSINYENGTVTEPSMKLYADWMEGEWYQIYTAEQFVENFRLSGNYVIQADLDFSELKTSWKAVAIHKEFTGTIQGNGHTFSNISFARNDTSAIYAGLFGSLAGSAVITDLHFDHVTFTIDGGTTKSGACYGLLAGSVAKDATLSNVTITNSVLQIDSDAYFGTDDYSIGLVSGYGATGIDASGITCQAVGDNPEKVIIAVSDGTVTVDIVTE